MIARFTVPALGKQRIGYSYSSRGMDRWSYRFGPDVKIVENFDLAMVTDFDCWHPEHDKVDVESVLKVMTANREKAQRLFARLVLDFPEQRLPCPAGSHHALDGAIITAPGSRDPEVLARLDAVAGRVLRQG
jgi:5'-methylthioadenosine phosphorylase